MAAPSPDDIADCILRTFDRLPTKQKPLAQSNGRRGWVPLSGIVLSRGSKPLLCASLGTGMKCLPRNKIPLAQGVVLHDWHAEILAIRAFNRFLFEECRQIATSGANGSEVIRRRPEQEISEAEFQPFTIAPDIGIHMYCSEAPCGDASMELTMDAQEDATPWSIPTTNITTSTSPGDSSGNREPELRGRGFFSQLGIVRRKPARADAPPSWSKSCSDKLALKQFTSLLSAPLSLLLSPRNAYISSLIVPASQSNSIGFTRAFSPSGRLKSAIPLMAQQELQEAGYAYRPFCIQSTTREFAFSRRSANPGEVLSPSNVSAVYTPHVQETLIGGCLQGRKQFDPRGASLLSRKKMWGCAMQVAGMVAVPYLAEVLSEGDGEMERKRTYGEFKGEGVFGRRKLVKECVVGSALRGWRGNDGDEGWELE